MNVHILIMNIMRCQLKYYFIYTHYNCILFIYLALSGRLEDTKVNFVIVLTYWS